MQRYKAFCIFLIIAFPLLLLTHLEASTQRGFNVKVRIKATENVNAPVVEEVDLYGDSHALVIGIDKYAQGWPILSGAVNDAKLVARELRKKGFKVTFKKNLNSSELKQTFEEFFVFKGENPQSRLFVWFAGHGHTLDGEGFLVPADAPKPQKTAQFKYKALSLRRFGEFVRLAKSKHAFAVFDSCFSGTIFDTQRGSPPAAITRATTLPVRQFLASGDAEQSVSDDGRFRKLFIRALKGEERADANGDGYLTGSELGMFLTDRITNLTKSRQTPRYGKLRDEDYDRGDFVFLLASSAAVVDKPAKIKRESYLSVESNIPGAIVFVNGRKVGTTPLSDVSVSVGEHHILVEKQGYEPYQRRIKFRQGRSRDLSVILDVAAPKKGALFVDTKPKDARVRILNIGPAFYQGIELEPGRYHVEVSADGHETKKLWVSLSAGEDKTLDIRLKRVAVARPTAGQGKKITNSIGMEFVYIPPGTFMMGSLRNEKGRDNDERQHQVTLTKGFYLQTTEVTQAQWKAVMGSNPSKFKRDNRPVEMVSWNDVQEFIRKLNRTGSGNRYRLPTEAEWEYAARAGSTTRFSFGDDEGRLGDYAWYRGNSGKRTHRVAQKKPNNWGFYDMHGNVWEWVQDWKGDYPSGSVTDPKGPSNGSARVLRGGGWNGDARYCRSASRSRRRPAYRLNNSGFRLVLLPGH